MKFGLNMLLYTGEFCNDTLPLLPKVAEMGFDGIDISTVAIDSIDIPATKRALEENGLEATSCNIVLPDQNLVSEDADVRKAGVKALKRCADFTKDIDASIMSGPMYSPVGQLVGRGRTPEEWDRCVECLKEVTAYADDRGITLAIEPLNRFETYFVNTIADTCELVEQVGEPNIGVMVDTFHAHIEEKDTAAAILAAGPKVKFVHACCNDRGTPGTGQIHWDTIFPALKDIGYDGWLTIESFVPAIPGISAAASIWRKIAPSQEALASEGLAFLKKKVAETWGE